LSELHIGAVTLIGETQGAHVQVTVLGAGSPGHRPLCGRVKMNAAEWASVNAARELVELERLRAEVEQNVEAHLMSDPTAEIAYLKAERDRLLAERDELRAEIEQIKNRLGLLSGVWGWRFAIRHKLACLVRDYPDDKETAAIIGTIDDAIATDNEGWAEGRAKGTP
jgi:hypothetical protein